MTKSICSLTLVDEDGDTIEVSMKYPDGNILIRIDNDGYVSGFFLSIENALTIASFISARATDMMEWAGIEKEMDEIFGEDEDVGHS